MYDQDIRAHLDVFTDLVYLLLYKITLLVPLNATLSIAINLPLSLNCQEFISLSLRYTVVVNEVLSSVIALINSKVLINARPPRSCPSSRNYG